MILPPLSLNIPITRSRTTRSGSAASSRGADPVRTWLRSHPNTVNNVILARGVTHASQYEWKAVPRRFEPLPIQPVSLTINTGYSTGPLRQLLGDMGHKSRQPALVGSAPKARPTIDPPSIRVSGDAIATVLQAKMKSFEGPNTDLTSPCC